MKTRIQPFHQPRQKFIVPDRSCDRLPACRRTRRAGKIQMVYAHYGPPVMCSVAEIFGYIPKLVSNHVCSGPPEVAGGSAGS